MLGLPLDAWLLLAAAVGLGLALELAFYARTRGQADTDGGPARPNEPGRPGADG